MSLQKERKKGRSCNWKMRTRYISIWSGSWCLLESHPRSFREHLEEYSDYYYTWFQFARKTTFVFSLQLYLTFHSYGQYILYPWGYARRDTPDRNDLHSLGLKGAQAAKSVNGRRYSVGTAAKMLYPAAGKLNFQTIFLFSSCCFVNECSSSRSNYSHFSAVCPFTAVNEAMCLMSILKLTLFVQAVFCQIPLSKGLWSGSSKKVENHFSSRTIHCIFKLWEFVYRQETWWSTC